MEHWTTKWQSAETLPTEKSDFPVWVMVKGANGSEATMELITSADAHGSHHVITNTVNDYWGDKREKELTGKITAWTPFHRPKPNQHS